MSFPLDLFQDLAVSRANTQPGVDPDAQFLRRRIASVTWMIGAGLAWFVALSLQNWVVGVLGIVTVTVGLWLFSERSDQIAALVRRLHRSRDSR